jgi:diguanylate cyclase (GGDEF)-like protein
MDDGEPRHAKVYLHHKEGHRIPVHVACAPIHDEAGHIVGALETFHDISAEIAALKEVESLREQSLLCPLTGVGNRRYCEEALRKRLDEARRNGGKLAIFFMDVDHFKQINDTHGHDVGDLVLKMIARTLSSSMRTYDFLGRWGGEEFIALAPNLPADEVEDFANRMRSLVARSSRDISNMALSVTMSVGAVLAQDGETMSEVVARADRLMYHSKEQGRNRVTVEV